MAQLRPSSPFLVVIPPQDRNARQDMKMLQLPTELIQFTDRRVQTVQTELQTVLTMYSSPRQPFCWSWTTQRELDIHCHESLITITIKLFHHAVWSTRAQDLTDCALWLLAVHRTYQHCQRPDIFHTFIARLKEGVPLVDDSNDPATDSKVRRRVLLDHCEYLQFCAPHQFLFFDYFGDYAARLVKIEEAKATNRQIELVMRTIQQLGDLVLGAKRTRVCHTDNNDSDPSDEKTVTKGKLRRVQ